MIRKRLQKIIRWAMNYDSDREPQLATSSTMVLRSDCIEMRGMNFTLYKASGGWVIEYRQYDRIKDENNNKLHIINSDDDIGEKIGQIITMELLRN